MGMSSAAHLAPTLEEIETLARAAIGRLPDIFRSHLDGVVLRVEEFPDSEVIAEMGLESPFDILGLYSGRPVGDKSIDLSGRSEEHTSELQSLMRNSYAVFCLKKKKKKSQ